MRRILTESRAEYSIRPDMHFRIDDIQANRLTARGFSTNVSST